MPDEPPVQSNAGEHTACPHCTIQIPADATVCPHCRLALPNADPRHSRPLPFSEPPSSAAVLWARYRKWVFRLGPVVAAVVVVLLLLPRWLATTVRVVDNPVLPVQVSESRDGDRIILRGTVTNRGDDVPDFSLRSIGVVVDLAFRDGRKERRTVFPKAPFRGKGALFKNETGSFEIAVPARGIREIVLSTQVVDLGMGRKLIRPRRR